MADNGSTDGAAAWRSGSATGCRRCGWSTPRSGEGRATPGTGRRGGGDRRRACSSPTPTTGWGRGGSRPWAGRSSITTSSPRATTPSGSTRPRWSPGRGNFQRDGLIPYTYPPFLPHAGGSSLGVKRALHEAIGGFDEDLPALEDTDYCWRIQLAGTPLVLVPERWCTSATGPAPGAGPAELHLRDLQRAAVRPVPRAGDASAGGVAGLARWGKLVLTGRRGAGPSAAAPGSASSAGGSGGCGGACAAGSGFREGEVCRERSGREGLAGGRAKWRVGGSIVRPGARTARALRTSRDLAYAVLERPAAGLPLGRSPCATFVPPPRITRCRGEDLPKLSMRTRSRPGLGGGVPCPPRGWERDRGRGGRPWIIKVDRRSTSHSTVFTRCDGASSPRGCPRGIEGEGGDPVDDPGRSRLNEPRHRVFTRCDEASSPRGCPRGIRGRGG